MATFSTNASLSESGFAFANHGMKATVLAKIFPPVPSLILTCALTLLGLGGCNNDSTQNAESPQIMKELLTEKLPKGLELSAAKALMEKEGFECVLKEKAPWKKKGAVDFLQCKRTDGSPPIFRIWDVAVFHDGKKITDFDVRSALKYP